MLKKLPALATTALIAAGIIAGPTAAGTANAADSTPTTRSGLAWNSGVFIPGDNASSVESFGTWRGAKTDVAVTWPARSNWNDVINATWLYDRWKGAPQTMVLGLPPFPENVGASLSACAAGNYNGYWKQFGTTIKNSGLSDRTIVRLGWEFNGNWYAWSAKNPGEFAACWRQVQGSAESTAPALRWDWNTNRGPSQLGIDSRQAYPGDAYVDIVGVDSYDGWPGVKSEADWNEHLNGAYGLKFWADFARQHGKKMSVPEWGVYPGTAWAGHNGGDNPLYIQKMFGFFKSQQDNLAYEAYFNEPASYYAGALSMNPKAAAEYKTQISAALAAPASPSTPAPTATATAAPSATATPAPSATTVPTATVTAPAVTVTAAPVTVTAPAVTKTVTATVTATVTVTAPPVTVTAPAVTVTAPPVTVTVTKAPKPTKTKAPKPTTSPKSKTTKKPVVKATNVMSVFTIVKLVQKVEAKAKKADAAKSHAAKIKAAKIKKATAKAKAQTVRKGVQAKATVRH